MNTCSFTSIHVEIQVNQSVELNAFLITCLKLNNISKFSQFEFSYLDKIIHKRCSPMLKSLKVPLKEHDNNIVYLTKLYIVLPVSRQVQVHLLSKYIYEFKFHSNKQ